MSADKQGLPVVAWAFSRQYGSGLSLSRPHDTWDEDGNAVAPQPLTDHATATAGLLAMDERIAELERENRLLTVKTTNSLANNLCSDHRDKQKGKPCLACAVETLTRERDALKADTRRIDWLADRDNSIGQVLLPTEFVTANLHSLRAAIDAAMASPKEPGHGSL